LVRVPDGDDVTTFVPIGSTMLSNLGIHVDTGNIVGRDRRYMHTYGPGDLAPNWLLGPINASNYGGPLGKYSVKLKVITTISALLDPDEGDIWISACSPVYVPAGKSLHDALSDLPIHVPGSTELAGTATVTIVKGQLHVSDAPATP
jgi:hypothetical protein